MTERKTYGGSPGTPLQIQYPRASAQTQQRQRQTDSQQYDYADDNPNAWTVEKTPNSAVRLGRLPRKTATLPDPKKTRAMRERRFDRWTLVICVCLLFIVMVGGWWLFSTIANWWTNVQDDWKYGSIRTYQADQFVGQGDSPDHPDHFIVVNTHGQVIVIQLNPQHPNLDHIYDITTTSDPKTPVSLSFRPTGIIWAMYVIIGDTNPYSVELVSDGKQFVSPH
jgi:hypothetical protein